MTTRRIEPWALVPVGLLAAMLVGLVSMAAIATNDPGFAIETNYYDKAVHWDQARAQAERDERLGFHLALASFASDTLELTLVDAAGKPISGARLSAEAFPLARSNSSTLRSVMGRQWRVVSSGKSLASSVLSEAGSAAGSSSASSSSWAQNRRSGTALPMPGWKPASRH